MHRLPHLRIAFEPTGRAPPPESRVATLGAMHDAIATGVLTPRTALRWAASEPAPFVVLLLVLTTAALAIDQVVNIWGQHALGLAGWVVLFAAAVYLSPLERSRVAVVIIVATLGEVVGSIIWGAYEYRLGNLPLFVPPGHGLVFLTGWRISQLGWVRAHARVFLGFVLAGLVGWALWGLVLAERQDVAGAIGAAFLAAFLIGGRSRMLYAGVFVFVAYLELYGTWVGTWTWAETLPGTGIPDGNPPSGIAAGYVLFDIAALTFAPALLAAVLKLKSVFGSPTSPTG